MKRLLVASDDVHTRAWVRAALEPLDVAVAVCDVAELDASLAAHDPELVVADGGREPEAVIQLLERAVAEGLEAKCLFLVEGEALGSLRLPASLPSDFVVRGASSEEVAARARALAWPGEEVAVEELIRVGELTMNLATYQVYRGSEPIDFTYLEYALLSFLVTHPNRAYSREMLLSRVWGSDYYGGSRTVDVHIRRIRAKIGPELSRHLETVRSVGYLWHS